MSRFLTPAVLAVSLFVTSAALADDDDCRSPMSQWQPQDVAIQHVVDLGFTVNRLKIDDGCYEVKGRDIDGNAVEMRFDPASLALVELDVSFRAGADPSRYIAGARGRPGAPLQAPAGNSLITPGSLPQVKNK